MVFGKISVSASFVKLLVETLSIILCNVPSRESHIIIPLRIECWKN